MNIAMAVSGLLIMSHTRIKDCCAPGETRPESKIYPCIMPRYFSQRVDLKHFLRAFLRKAQQTLARALMSTFRIPEAVEAYKQAGGMWEFPT